MATVKTYVYTGISPGSGAEATKLRFKLADNNLVDGNNPIIIPSVGSRYSFWKSIALFAETAPQALINNIKIYSDSFKLIGCARLSSELLTFDTGRSSAIVDGMSLGLTGAYKVSRNAQTLYIIKFSDTQPGASELYIVDISDFGKLTLTDTISIQRTNCDIGQTSGNNTYDVLAYSAQYILILGGSLCFPGTANPRTSIWVYDSVSQAITENYFFNGYAYRHAGVIKGSVLYMVRPARIPGGNNFFSTFNLSTLPTVANLGNRSFDSDADYGEVVARSSSSHAFFSLQKSNKVYAVNVSNPSILTDYVSTAITDPRGLVLIDDNHLVICQENQNKISIYNVTSPMSPLLVSSLTDATNLAGAGFVVYDSERKYLYISCPTTDRLTIVDVSDISNPEVVNSITNANYEGIYGLLGLESFGLGWKNCSIHIGDQTTSTYAQATGSDQAGDEMVANHPEITSKSNLFSFVATSPKSVSGSIGIATGRISDFVVLQIEVTSDAIAGIKNEEALLWRFDEV